MTVPKAGIRERPVANQSDQCGSLRSAWKNEHKGWYSRGYLPHFDSPGILQGITFRLFDALPAHVVATLLDDSDSLRNPEKRAQLEDYLNVSYGVCYLRDPRIGRMVEEVLLHFDGERYRLIAWVVMPNHVHVLIETFEGYPLPAVVQSWKSYTAKQANLLLGHTGRFWYRSYFDRYVRDERHFWAVVNYIHNNPVKAGLVADPKDWHFSSARFLLD